MKKAMISLTVWVVWGGLFFLAGCSSGAETSSNPGNDTGLVMPGQDTGTRSSVDDADEPDTAEPPEDEDIWVEPGPDSDATIEPDAEPAGDAGITDSTEEEELPPPPKECIDLDGDGYGDDCYLGNDCDDSNPNFTIYCPPCETQTIEGCKCLQEGITEMCYESDPGSVGIGVCQLGQRNCQLGYWTACIGQITPIPEICDDLDNDCDGQVDEGVLSPCGDCDPFCDTLEVGPEGAEPFEPTEDNSGGIGTNLDGHLILDSSQINLGFIWVANSGEGTVSKLDTETGEELGRYNTCGSPSRTAVDLMGNVYVGCRSGGGVAKIAIDEAICIDKNGNGVIDTSDGSWTMPSGQDECVLYIVYPGGSCARALGVDSDNHAWVGMWNAKTLKRLEPDTGAVVASVNIPANPYGLVIDGNGVIWVSGRGGDKLVRVDPKVEPIQVSSWGVPGGNLYGINVDANGNVWMGQYSNGSVAKFTTANQSFTNISVGGCPRGMAGSVDGFMYTGLGCGGNHSVVKIDVNTHAVSSLDTNGPNGGGVQPIGVALDSEGFVWAVNYQTSNASKIDPVTGQVNGPYPVGANPYTYSDMTGYALHNFTAPQGHYTTDFGGWEEIRVKWEALYVDADMPENSHLKLEVRTAETYEELEEVPWQGLFGPYPPELFPLDLAALPNMEGKILQVKVWLFSADKLSTPVVKAIKAKFASE